MREFGPERVVQPDESPAPRARRAAALPGGTLRIVGLGGLGESAAT